MPEPITTIKYNKVFSKLGHECEMLADEDELIKKIPGTSVWVRFRRMIGGSLLVNEKICKACSIHLRSHGAIQKEKRRQMTKYPHSIHTFSTMKIAWDFFMIVVWFCLLITVPLDIAFFDLHDTAPFIRSAVFLSIRVFLDLALCADIVVSSMTGYYDESKKEVVLGRKQIFMHYLKTTFFLDIIIAFPTHFDLIIDMEASREMHTFYQVLQGISTLKFCRYFQFETCVIKLCNIFRVDFFVRHLMLLIICMLLFWHVLSSAVPYFYVIFEDPVIREEYDNTTFFRAFAQNLYQGALIFYTSSYGVHAPRREHQYIIINIAWIISKFVQIYCLARIIEYIRAKTSPKIKYSQVVRQLVEFMRHKKLPLYTQRRILTYYEFHFQKSYFRENEIYATISGQLRQEITMQNCRQLVENVEFFRDLPLNLLIRIVTCLQSEIYLTNDLVVKANTVGQSMYFIASGTVAVYTNSGKEVCHLDDGSYFGEVALVAADCQRIATVIAAETCELYRLDRKDFVKAIHPYPDLLEKIQKIAADRKEKTTMLDEHNVKKHHR